MNQSKYSRDLKHLVPQRHKDEWSLSIISLVDILTILLVFLLANVSVEGQKFTQPNRMAFPVSMKKRDLLEKKGTTVVQIYPDRILIGDRGIYFGTLNEFANDPVKRTEILKYLQTTALQILEDKDESGNPRTPPTLLIQADRAIPCWYITEFVSLGTSAYYEYIYFATLLDANWFQHSVLSTRR